MSVNQSEQPRTILQRKKRSRWRWLLLIPALIPILPYFGTFSPMLSPLVYPTLAPPGWHNITPHGNIIIHQFAASTDTPGLMMTCGIAFSLTVNNPSTWILGQVHFWLSHDGGAHWSILNMPKSGGSDCGVAMPSGEPGDIIATIYSTSDPRYTMVDATTWMSRDSGASWHEFTTSSTNGGNPISLFGTAYTLGLGAGIYFRHGVFYGSGLEDYTNGTELVFSADGGATWTSTLSTPDALEQQGWQISSNPAPDYREDQWWYRTLSKPGQPPMLEHSTDDGRTWTAIEAIGNEPIQSVLLATTPLLPGHLCAAHPSEETDHLSILASADNGKSWQAGTMPSSLANTNGETGFALNIGANGDCYQGYHYRHGHASWDDDSNYGFLDLASKSSTLQVIPLGSDQNILDDTTIYVPAGNGMKARLIANPGLPTPGWAAAFSGLATETSKGQILWAAVP